MTSGKYIRNNVSIFLSLIICLLLIQFGQSSLGSFEKNSCVEIKTILNTSAVTLSTLAYPNGTLITSEQTMSNVAGNTWSYTDCNTSVFGTYTYDYYDAENNVYVNDYTIAPAFELNNPIVNFYLGTLAVLIFFFILVLIFLAKLPQDDNRDNDGYIMSINSLKYFKYPLWAVAWGLLVIISFVIFNFAEGYIVEGLILTVFKMIFRLLLISATIGVPVIFWFGVAKFMQDQVIKRMIERNIYN